jgi:phosphoglycolate phosphatase
VKVGLVLLDLDGTLVDSFADIAAGIRAACQGCGMTASEEILALARRGVPLEDFYRAAARLEPVGEGFARFADEYRASYLPGCAATTLPYPGVVETLHALRARAPRPRLAVATTKRTETARRVLEATGLLPLLDAVVGSDGLAPKPDPAVLRAAAAAAGGDLNGALMVGDTDRDVLAARRAGCAAAAVTYGGLSAEELARHRPDYLLATFSDLLWVLT